MLVERTSVTQRSVFVRLFRAGLTIAIAGQALPGSALTVVANSASVSVPQRNETPVRSTEQRREAPVERGFGFKVAGWVAILSVFALVGTNARRRSPSRIVTN